MTEFVLRFLFGFVFGAVFGSFATMLAYRIPNKISIVFPRSRCTSCETVLGIKDLFPIFSFLLSKGKCRHCKETIPKRYFYTELFMSLSFALTTCVIGFSWILIPLYAIILAGTIFITQSKSARPTV